MRRCLLNLVLMWMSKKDDLRANELHACWTVNVAFFVIAVPDLAALLFMINKTSSQHENVAIEQSSSVGSDVLVDGHCGRGGIPGGGVFGVDRLRHLISSVANRLDTCDCTN